MSREIKIDRVLLAFLIALFLFSLGLLLGYLVKGVIESKAISVEETVRNELIMLETLSLLEKDYPCNSFILDKSSERLDFVGNLITQLEKKSSKFDPRVLELKKVYSVLEARHLVLVKERNNRCGDNYTTILYFYSNQKECDSEVTRISFILTFLRRKYDFVRVYSFDIDLDSDILGLFKKEYDLNQCYRVVINDKEVEGYIENSDNLEEIIKENR